MSRELTFGAAPPPAKTFEESGGTMAESVAAAYALLLALSSVMTRIYGKDWDRRGEVALFRQVASEADAGPLTPQERVALQFLHFQAGGWWAWLDDEEQGPSFVPTPNWVPYFNVKQAFNVKRSG